MEDKKHGVGERGSYAIGMTESEAGIACSLAVGIEAAHNFELEADGRKISEMCW